MELSDLMRRFRKEAGMTQVELAEAADVSRALIGRAETGDLQPQLETIREIEEALDRPGEIRALLISHSLREAAEAGERVLERIGKEGDTADFMLLERKFSAGQYAERWDSFEDYLEELFTGISQLRTSLVDHREDLPLPTLKEAGEELTRAQNVAAELNQKYSKMVTEAVQETAVEKSAVTA